MPKLPYGLARALARVGLVKKPAPPAIPTTPGGPHLQTLALAVKVAAEREAEVQAKLPGGPHQGQETYLQSLNAAARLLRELAKAAAVGDARGR